MGCNGVFVRRTCFRDGLLSDIIHDSSFTNNTYLDELTNLIHLSSNVRIVSYPGTSDITTLQVYSVRCRLSCSQRSKSLISFEFSVVQLDWVELYIKVIANQWHIIVDIMAS